MKKLTSLLAAVLLACGLFTIAGCSSGCKSPSRSAYVTSGVTHVAAVAGLRAWNDYLGVEYASITEQAATDGEGAAKRQLKLLEREKQVADAWAKYQASQLAVLTAAQEFAKIPPNDPAAPNAQDRLNAAVAASSVTLSAVITLLQQFGISVK